MTVRELYTKIDIDLQEINSNVFGDVLPEEKDIVVNEEILEFVRDNIDPKSNRLQQGFQTTNKRYDNIKELLNTETLPLYKKSETTSFAILPDDYFAHISSNTNINCSTFTNVVTSVPKYLYTFKLEDDSAGYVDFTITKDAVDIFTFTVAKYPEYPTGILNDEKFILLNLIREDLFTISELESFEVYYEWYNGTYYPNQFILITDAVSAFTITYHTGETPIALSLTNTLTYSRYDVTDINKISGNRLTSYDDIDDVAGSYFRKTSSKSPVVELAKHIIIVHHEKRFIPISIELRYVCRPRKISLLLNRNVNLSTDVLGMIAKRTAERLAVIKGTPNTQLLVQHNNTFIE